MAYLTQEGQMLVVRGNPCASGETPASVEAGAFDAADGRAKFGSRRASQVARQLLQDVLDGFVSRLHGCQWSDALPTLQTADSPCIKGRSSRDRRDPLIAVHGDCNGFRS